MEKQIACIAITIQLDSTLTLPGLKRYMSNTFPSLRPQTYDRSGPLCTVFCKLSKVASLPQPRLARADPAPGTRAHAAQAKVSPAGISYRQGTA